MIDTKLRKFGIWSLFIVIILTFGLRLFYFGTFFLIKRVDPTIFCRQQIKELMIECGYNSI